MKRMRSQFLLFSISALLFPLNMFSGSVRNDNSKFLLPPKDKVRTVVIDPGHGGKDSGCLGSSVNEKNVALAISLKLGKLIEEHFPDVKVIFTRKTDVFIELYQRAEIANKANADLFICIHCNAGASEAHGSETYALGLHRAESNLAVAKRENESILLEDNYNQNYDGFDVNSPEGSIIFSLYQNTFLNRSLSFAEKCQKYFTNKAGRLNRGVKQAGFLVLVKTAMPAVLIESGFLTNKTEEKYLMQAENQQEMATCIFNAFTDYKNEVEGTAFKPQIQENVIQEVKADKTDTEIKAVVINEPVFEAKVTDENPVIQEVKDSEKKCVFKVQFKSSENFIKIDSPQFNGIENVQFYKSANVYKYTSGETVDIEVAKKIQNHLRTKGFTDAFVIAMYGNERISIKEALEILNKNQ